MTELPSSIDDTLERLAALDYVSDRELATCVYLALKLQRPLFLEGEPGTGTVSYTHLRAHETKANLV